MIAQLLAVSLIVLAFGVALLWVTRRHWNDRNPHDQI